MSCLTWMNWNSRLAECWWKRRSQQALSLEDSILLLSYLNDVPNKPHLGALHDPLLHPHQHLVNRAGCPWSGNWITLMGAHIWTTEYWSLLSHTGGVNCPFRFMPDELKTFHEQEEIWFGLNMVVEYWQDQTGVGENGWVSNERYDNAVERARQLMAIL